MSQNRLNYKWIFLYLSYKRINVFGIYWAKTWAGQLPYLFMWDNWTLLKSCSFCRVLSMILTITISGSLEPIKASITIIESLSTTSRIPASQGKSTLSSIALTLVSSIPRGAAKCLLKVASTLLTWSLMIAPKPFVWEWAKVAPSTSLMFKKGKFQVLGSN